MTLTIWFIISPKRGETPQRELESCGKIQSALNLHGNLSLSELDGALLAIHQGVCTIVQPLHEHLSGEGASKREQVSNSHGRGQECLSDA